MRKFGRSSFAEQGAVYGLLRSTDGMKRMVLSELYRLNSARSLFWWPGADDPLRLQHAIFQSPVDPSPHEVYAALQVLGAMKSSGGLVFLPVGSKPFPDRDIESNRSALASVTSLQHITGNSEISFRADVWCGNADCDGSITIGGQVEVCSPWWRKGMPVAPTMKELPSHIPLEIGFTRGWTTHFHLLRSRAIARWPYGHDYITLMLLDDAMQRSDGPQKVGAVSRPSRDRYHAETDANEWLRGRRRSPEAKQALRTRRLLNQLAFDFPPRHHGSRG